MKRIYNLKIDRVPHSELKFKTFKKVSYAMVLISRF